MCPEPSKYWVRYGIDVVRSAAVVRDVREVAVEQAFIVRVEGEARRLGGFGGGLRRCVSCRSRSAGVRYDAEDRCARGARSRARRRGGGERQRCEDEKRDRARGGSPHSSHRVPETDGNGENSAALQRARVLVERAERRLERRDRGVERAGVALEPRQLLREILGLARDVARVELSRRGRREIRVECLELAGDPRRCRGERAGSGRDAVAVLPASSLPRRRASRRCGQGPAWPRPWPCVGVGLRGRAPGRSERRSQRTDLLLEPVRPRGRRRECGPGPRCRAAPDDASRSRRRPR